MPAVTAGTFRKALRSASQRYGTGRAASLYPHLLRHACATHRYQAGMSLWEVQKLLGHDRPTTTVRYLATAHADPETAAASTAALAVASATRAAQRLVVDKGNLR